ncbi:hypothetical protein RFI_06667, partial [Reticulomyxa filosa]
KKKKKMYEFVPSPTSNSTISTGNNNDGFAAPLPRYYRPRDYPSNTTVTAAAATNPHANAGGGPSYANKAYAPFRRPGKSHFTSSKNNWGPYTYHKNRGGRYYRGRGKKFNIITKDVDSDSITANPPDNSQHDEINNNNNNNNNNYNNNNNNSDN